MPVDVSSVCIAIAVLAASLGSLTDTFNCNWDSAYANEFPVAVEDLDVYKPRTTVQGAIGPYGGGGGHKTLLEGFDVITSFSAAHFQLDYCAP